MTTKPISDNDLDALEAFTQGFYPVDKFISSHGEIQSLIARLRAAEKDAARWRHARRILPVETIEQCQADFTNYGMVGCERENERADKAIDTAMEQQP